jgi:hypothetical protein
MEVVRMDLREIGWETVDWMHIWLRIGTSGVFFEQDNELSGSIKSERFFFFFFFLTG